MSFEVEKLTVSGAFGRDVAVDIARGIAIIIMIGANMGPVLLEPHSWFMRIYSSIAAPVFIILAGMMVEGRARDTSWRTGRRVIRLLFWAAFTDMAAWGVRPFLGVDVLYLIAMGTVALYFIHGLPTIVLTVVALCVAAETPFLQQTLGYTTYPTELSLLSGNITVAVNSQTPVWHHYIIDGWFPLFPWLSFMIVGALIARYRWRESSMHEFGAKWFLCGALCILVGWLLWRSYPGNMYDREGFSEIFYPPTMGFVISALGGFLVILSLVDMTYTFRGWNPVRVMGQSPLLIYVLHSIIIGRIFARWWGSEKLDNMKFLLVYALFVAGMIGAAFIMSAVRKRTYYTRLHSANGSAQLGKRP